MDEPLIFKKFPALRDYVDWISLGEFPTPVQRMDGISKAEGLSDFYVKRDDLSSSIYGGNKVRKLEFLLAHAKEKGRDCLVTFGAAGSNHVVATVIHGGRLGIKTIAVMFAQPNAAYVRKNLLLDYVNGVGFSVAPTMGALPAAFLRALREGFDREKMKPPYIIPPGGSNARGCLGYVNCALELKQQIDEGLLPEPEFIFVTLGSSGTAAGMILGVEIAGLSSRVVPVRVVEKPVCNRTILNFHVNNTRAFIMRRSPWTKIRKFRREDILLIDDFAGERYAQFTPEAVEAVRKARELDGLKLECTYTGKTLAGALDFIHRNGLEKRPSLFINTYNSVDLYPAVSSQDYHVLPKELHHYFESPLQEEELGCEIVH